MPTVTSAWLIRQARAATSALTEHIRDCEDCRPPGKYCWLGDLLEQAVQDAAAAKLRVEATERRSKR